MRRRPHRRRRRRRVAARDDCCPTNSNSRSSSSSRTAMLRTCRTRSPPCRPRRTTFSPRLTASRPADRLPSSPHLETICRPPAGIQTPSPQSASCARIHKCTASPPGPAQQRDEHRETQQAGERESTASSSPLHLWRQQPRPPSPSRNRRKSGSSRARRDGRTPSSARKTRSSSSPTRSFSRHPLPEAYPRDLGLCSSRLSHNLQALPVMPRLSKANPLDRTTRTAVLRPIPPQRTAPTRSNLTSRSSPLSTLFSPLLPLRADPRRGPARAAAAAAAAGPDSPTRSAPNAPSSCSSS